MNKKEFDTEFCNVKYMEEDKVVLLTWKKFSSFDNYRRPATFALDLLREYPGSSFIVDARNGFEDEKEDVEWGFSFLIPNMAKTGCTKVAFIMNEVSDIKEEMDMWTKEFLKYFRVDKVDSYEKAIQKLTD
jgi:hypothetical protein